MFKWHIDSNLRKWWIQRDDFQHFSSRKNLPYDMVHNKDSILCDRYDMMIICVTRVSNKYLNENCTTEVYATFILNIRDRVINCLRILKYHRNAKKCWKRALKKLISVRTLLRVVLHKDTPPPKQSPSTIYTKPYFKYSWRQEWEK